jgi:polyribonucleotide nucleotidyltransferase
MISSTTSSGSWRLSEVETRNISEISDRRVKDVRDELKEGQQIMVKCIGKEGNKVKLSRKAILAQEKAAAGGGGNGDRGGRGEE